MQGLEEYLKQEGFDEPEILGEGSSATVLVAYSEKEGYDVALKVIPQELAEFEMEDSILGEVANRRIIKKYRTINDPAQKYAIIVLEMMDHDLMDTIEATGALSEAKGRSIFYEVCRAILFCHSKQIAHLDIKPENILLDDGEEETVLTDFGTSYHFELRETVILPPVGTFFYCAPEITAKEPCYPDKADIWSLGILLHVILTGTWPYAGANYEEACENAAEGKIYILKKKLSGSAADLIFRMLNRDPVKRYDIIQVLDHGFFQKIVRRPSEMEHKLSFGVVGTPELKGGAFSLKRSLEGKPRTSVINTSSKLSRVASLNNSRDCVTLKLSTLDRSDTALPSPQLKTPRVTEKVAPRINRELRKVQEEHSEDDCTPEHSEESEPQQKKPKPAFGNLFKRIREMTAKLA